jgi:hypothetical protein
MTSSEIQNFVEDFMRGDADDSKLKRVQYSPDPSLPIVSAIINSPEFADFYDSGRFWYAEDFSIDELRMITAPSFIRVFMDACVAESSRPKKRPREGEDAFFGARPNISTNFDREGFVTPEYRHFQTLDGSVVCRTPDGQCLEIVSYGIRANKFFDSTEILTNFIHHVGRSRRFGRISLRLNEGDQVPQPYSLYERLYMSDERTASWVVA